MADDDFQQQLNYKVNVDRSDVYQAINEIEQRAQQSAQSVTAMSSNVLSQIAQMQAGALGTAGMQPGMMGNPMAQMNAMQAAMYAGSTMPFSSQNMIAQDMYQRQVMSMGPSSGFGPAMTTPAGTPTINPFLTPAPASYTLPTGNLQQFGGPGQPNEPPRSRLFFGTGEGSAFNLLFHAGSGMLRRKLFGGTGLGFTNDNLEDPIYRMASRYDQYFAENLYEVGAGMANFAGSTAAGIGGGALANMASARFGLGGLASAGLGLGAGLIASAGFDAASSFISSRNRPYLEGAQDLRDYMAPYVRGTGLGGAFSYRDTLRLQRDLEKQVANDNFFNAGDYRTLINMAGDTGMFQMTGSKDQALKALENMSKSVKTLYALGVKSREQLQAIDLAFNQFGVSAGTDPTRLANLFQTFATSAMSAGMSTTQVAQASAPIAQAAMAQGIGPTAGGILGAQNLAVSGAMFRQGSLSDFDNAYFGGTQGFANALSGGQLSMLRSPVGQAMLAGMFAPGSQVLGSVLNQRNVSPLQAMNGVAGFAGDPLMYAGLMARMPQLTNNLGSELQYQSMQMGISAYKQLGLQLDEDGKINPTRLIALLTTKFNLPPNEALAMVESLQNAPKTAVDIRRSAGEQMSIQAMEGLRHTSLKRFIEKLIERNIDTPIVRGATAARERANDISDYGASLIGRIVSGRNVQDAQELVTGVRQYRISEVDRSLLDAGGRAQKATEARNYAEEMGVSFELAPPDNQRQLSPEVSAALNDSTSRAQIVAALRRSGMTSVTAENVEAVLASGTRYNSEDVTVAAQNSRAFQQVQQGVRQAPGLSAGTRDAVERAALDLYKNQQSRLRDVLSGFRDLNDEAHGDMAQALRGRLRGSVGAIQAAARRDQANKGDALSSFEATGRAIVATMPEVFNRKSYDEVVSDPQLANTLGRYIQAYSAETGDKAGAQVLDAAGDNGEASTNEQLTKYLDSLKSGGERTPFFEMGGAAVGALTGGAAGRVAAGVTGRTVAAAGRYLSGIALRGLFGTAGRWLGGALGTAATPFTAGLGTGTLTIGGALLGGLAGDYAGAYVEGMIGQPNESFSAVVDDDKGKAGGRLTAGINEALLQIMNEGGDGMSYDDLVARVRSSTGFDSADAERMLSEAGLYRGSFAQDRDALREQMGKVAANITGGNGKEGDAKALALMNDARRDPRALLGGMYKARRSINSYLNSAGYRLDEGQMANLEALRGKGVNVISLRKDVEGTDAASLKRAINQLIAVDDGSNKETLNTFLKLTDRAGQDPTEEDAQAAAGLGLASYGAKGVTAANRVQMLRGALVGTTFGGPSLEKATLAAGGVQSTQQLAGIQESIKKQTEVANSLAVLSQQLGKDNDFIKTALKGTVGKVSDTADAETLHGFAKRFGEAVDKFANTVGVGAKPATSNTSGKAPLQPDNTPKTPKSP